jgi:hypothetical protein
VLLCNGACCNINKKSTKCRIDTVISPDDGHIVTRNMEREEINVLRKIVHKLSKSSVQYYASLHFSTYYYPWLSLDVINFPCIPCQCF